MWNQEKKASWLGVVGLACAMVGLGCVVPYGYNTQAAYPQYGLQVRTGPEAAKVPSGFSLPVSTDESGLLPVPAQTDVVSGEIDIVSTRSLTGSFNASVPTGSTLVMEIRARLGTMYKSSQPKEWTPWVRIAWAGEMPKAKQTPLDQRLGSIEIDELNLARGADRMQVRLRLESSDMSAVAKVSRIDIPIEGNDYGRSGTDSDRLVPIDIPVPFRSQQTSDSSLSGRLCSPTSVAMVLAYYGVDATVEEVAKKCFDPEYGIYGNWPRNIQAAYEFGVPGSLARFETWSAASKFLEKGQPLIISIRAEKGDLRGAPYEATEGHLIVLRGIDEFGNVIVNDPACGSAEDGKRVYRRSDLTKVWLQATNGAAYVLGTPELVQQARARWNKQWNNAVQPLGSGR